MGSSGQQAEHDRDGDGSRRSALALVKEAGRILTRYLRPASHPREETRTRFVQSGDLERVLVLITQAIELDPDEPAYPWNLASSLRRLDQPQFALAFIEQAIRVATEVGDSEWADEHVHLAWADTALAARQFDVALVALARAREKTHDVDVLAETSRLAAAVAHESGDERRAQALAVGARPRAENG